MIDFSERKEQNGQLEQELAALKAEYLKHRMPVEQVEKLRANIAEEGCVQKKAQRKIRRFKYIAAAAVFAGAFLILPNTSAAAADAMKQIPVIGHLVKAVTFRDYAYQSERNMADVKIPELLVEEQQGDHETQKKLEKTTQEINAEISRITEELLDEFEEHLKYDYGYQDVVVDSEVLATTNDYFTLKLNCYQGAGSGYAWNYFYTIDLKTGERLKLKDIFQEGADFVTPISENIKQQMKTQMAEDENVAYWLDSDVEEWNFKAISEDTSFYLNEKGNIVIAFNEGDVAPMYMGTVEFEIPAEAVREILKS